MSKRKAEDEESVDEQQHTKEIVDVNFDYYNVNAKNDYHAIHRLLIQLFGVDAERVKTGPLTELVTTVAESSGVGSTIKTEEDEDSDPYAVLTVISCRDHAGLAGVIAYVLSKTRADQPFHDALSSALEREHVGLVLSERLVNMPVQVMGPMYRMLAEEMDGAECAFTHLLFLSRVYRLTAEDERETKRHRPAQQPSADGVYGFHPEDEVIAQHATHVATYGVTDENHVGVAVGGRAMVVPGSEWKGVVDQIAAMYACE